MNPYDLSSYEINSLFSENLFKEMKRQHITSAELARMTGMSDRVISAYRRVYRSPRLDTVVFICRALKISPNDLLNWKEIEKNGRTEQNSLEKGSK